MKKERHPPTLLIDGDVYAYQAACATEQNITFDGDTFIRTGSLEEAVSIFESRLESLLRQFKTDQYIIALTHAENFRKTLFPAYKSNRKAHQKPVTLSALREHIQGKHPTFIRPTLEADDILGILATSTKIVKHPGEKIIVSVDKDMQSIPGVFHSIKDGVTQEITEEDADRWHMYQTLIGDTADGYPGCPGIGPVKAARILAKGNSYAEWWPLVVKAYEKAGLTEEDALTQARVARILRCKDYDFKRKEVKLWKI